MEPVHTSGTAARELGVAVETLRRYEGRGIVKPERDASGRRLYTTKDLDKVRDYQQRQRGRDGRRNADK